VPAQRLQLSRAFVLGGDVGQQPGQRAARQVGRFGCGGGPRCRGGRLQPCQLVVEQPVASNADAAGRARNRRVEITPTPRPSTKKEAGAS
jgi:hypothetical protein